MNSSDNFFEAALARMALVSVLFHALVSCTYKMGRGRETITMSNDPRQIINDRPMSILQIIAVALTIGLNALDGFDVLSISFASINGTIASSGSIASGGIFGIRRVMK